MGKVTPDQLRNAYQVVTGRDGAHREGLAAVQLAQADALADVGQRSALMLGVEVGMELVRRYGVLALDSDNLAALGAPAEQTVFEIGHRHGMHIAYASRRQFNEFLCGDATELGELEMTDQQWMELDDRYDEHCDGLAGDSAADYLRETVERAGWRLVDGCWVYRPEGWDQP